MTLPNNEPVVERVSFEPLRDFVTTCYRSAGLADEDAALVADALVRSDLRGIQTHGVIRLPDYIAKLVSGGLNPRPRFTIDRDFPATAVMNGDNGPGQLVCAHAMRLAMDKASVCGVSFVAVRESCYFGSAAYFAMIALSRDMIGFVWSNGYPMMSAWQGYGHTLSNSPLSYAIPAGDHRPVVLDASMSTIAAGKVRLAAREGRKIPPGWIVTADGQNTTDPNELEKGASLLPLGHKGYGLAVVGDLLSSVLAGGPFSLGIPLWFADPARKTHHGQVVMAIDISKFEDVIHFKRRVDQFIDEVKASPKMPGFDEILAPGELEFRAEEENLRRGIPLASATRAALDRLAKELNVGNTHWDRPSPVGEGGQPR